MRNFLLNWISSSISSPFLQPHFTTASGRNPCFRNWLLHSHYAWTSWTPWATGTWLQVQPENTAVCEHCCNSYLFYPFWHVLSLSHSPCSNTLVTAMQQFNFRGNLKIRKKLSPIMKFRSIFDLPNEQVLSPKDTPDIWALKHCQDREQLACSDEQPVFWDLRDKPDKMLDRNKTYSNSIQKLESRIRTQMRGK